MNSSQDTNTAAYLETLLETIPDAVWIKGLDGKFVNCNKAFEVLIDAKKEDILGKTDFDFFEKEKAEFFRKRDEEAMKGDKPLKNEEAISKRGEDIVLETVKTRMRGPNGEIIGLMGIAREISERKQAETKLKKRLELITKPFEGDDVNISFEDLFELEKIQLLQDQFAEATRVASVITTVDGIPITKPSNFNSVSDQVIFGTGERRKKSGKSGAIIGSYDNDGPAIQESMNGILWDAGAGISVGGRHVANWVIGQVRDAEQTQSDIIRYAEEIGANKSIMREAFKEIPAMTRKEFKCVSSALYTLAGQLSKSAYQNYLQARHIIEREQFEETIVSANKELQEMTDALTGANQELSVAVEKAEDSDRLKSAFLANMSHEIRTPLNAIIGFADLLLEDETSEEDLKHYAEIISRSGENLLELINNIMDISKMDVGLTTLNYEATDAVSFLGQLRDIYAARLLQRNVSSVTVDLKMNVKDLGFMTDQVRLRQIFDNLLGNALKFTRDGVVEIGVDTSAENLLFWVRDTGVGIEPSQQDAVFERFKQASETTEKLYGGTGLGLSIVKSCVELMEGEIWIDSAIGEGTTFFFKLPYIRTKKNTENVSEGPQQSHTFNNEHILIAEDGELNYEYIATALKKYNLRISRVENGEEAVEKMRKENDIQLILMDVRMPKLDGVEATRAIRKFNQEIPIIAQTANSFDSDEDDCLAAGCNDFLSKPIRRKHLLECLHRHLYPAGS